MVIIRVFHPDRTDRCNSKGGYTAWIGGRYETKKMYFIWSESGEKVNYTNWYPPNPDNYRNQEHFIQMLDCDVGMIITAIKSYLSYVRKNSMCKKRAEMQMQ